MAAFVQSYGLQVVDKGGQAFDTKQLGPSDVIAFYFSAHWCPPCRHFTPLLKKFVETLESQGEKTLKVIFVSSDKTEAEMWEYMFKDHGNWLALAYSDREGKSRLERQFQVSGIPQLVVIDQVGRHAIRDARSEVMAACSSSSTQVLTTYLGWKTSTGAAPSRPARPSIQSGCKVKLQALVGASEHNGTVGTVDSFDASKQRYVVDLGSDKRLSLKSSNLLQLVTVRVGEDEMEIADFDEASGDLLLQAKSAEDSEGSERREWRGKHSDPGGPVLPHGTLVTVQNLQAESAKCWNEQNGLVSDYDAEAQRYVVQVDASKTLKIKPDNLRLCPLA